MAINMDAARNCRTPLIGVNDPRYTNGAGCVENIHISDMNVYATERNAKRAVICLESNIKNFMIDRFIRNAENDAYDSGVSVRIRNIGSSEIITESLTTEQAGLLSSNKIAVKQSSPYKKDICRIMIKIETGDVFTLPTGSFSRLYVNNIEN